MSHKKTFFSIIAILIIAIVTLMTVLIIRKNNTVSALVPESTENVIEEVEEKEVSSETEDTSSQQVTDTSEVKEIKTNPSSDISNKYPEKTNSYENKALEELPTVSVVQGTKSELVEIQMKELNEEAKVELNVEEINSFIKKVEVLSSYKLDEDIFHGKRIEMSNSNFSFKVVGNSQAGVIKDNSCIYILFTEDATVESCVLDIVCGENIINFIY